MYQTTRGRMWLAWLAAAGTLLPLAGCGSHGAEHASEAHTVAKPVAIPSVPVTEVALEVWPRTVQVQGSLLGYEQSVIGSRIAGRVEEVLVDLGSPIRKGQALVVLDRRELELKVLQAEAALRQVCAAIGLTPDESEQQLRRENSPPVQLERALVQEAQAASERAKQLQTRQAISQSEVERIEAQLKTADARYRSALNRVGEQIAAIGLARADLALAQQQLDDAEILAPFDGIVERRQISPGEYVQIGQPIVTLVRTDKLRYTAGVPENYAESVRKGQTIRISPAGSAHSVEAVISRVSPAVNQASRSLWLEADVPNEELHLNAGLFAEADIIIDPSSKTLTVPALAVTEFAGIQKVWLIAEGKAKEQQVRTGRREQDRVEIVSGLEVGETIVSEAGRGRAGEVVAVRDPVKRVEQAVAPVDTDEKKGLFE